MRHVEVTGAEHPADWGTKTLYAATLLNHVFGVCAEFAAGRPAPLPKGVTRPDGEAIPAEGGCTTREQSRPMAVHRARAVPLTCRLHSYVVAKQAP